MHTITAQGDRSEIEVHVNHVYYFFVIASSSLKLSMSLLVVQNTILPPSRMIKVCSTITRSISSSAVQNAGFQGKQGQNYSPEQRQTIMERKKRLIRKLENVPLEMKPIKDFYIPYSWSVPDLWVASSLQIPNNCIVMWYFSVIFNVLEQDTWSTFLNRRGERRKDIT